MPDSDPRLSDGVDALLARGRLGGPLRDEIAKRVLDARALPRSAAGRNWRRTVMVVAAPIAAIAAGVALFVAPGSDRALTAKGSIGAGPTLEIVCATGDRARCPGGQKLFVLVEDAPSGSGFLQAWAEPLGGGQRVWYFVGDSALAVAGQPGRETLTRAVQLGPEQPPGAYRIHLVLSRRRLAQTEALEGRQEVLATATLPLEVTR